jgi:hypothetical protein
LAGAFFACAGGDGERARLGSAVGVDHGTTYNHRRKDAAFAVRWERALHGRNLVIASKAKQSMLDRRVAPLLAMTGPELVPISSFAIPSGAGRSL